MPASPILIVAGPLAALVAAGLAFVGYRAIVARRLLRAQGLDALHQQMRAQEDFCPLAEISPSLLLVILGLEDFSFFEHRGYDLRRIRAALVTNLKALRARMGGSSITQQLAKNLYFSFEKTYARKLSELFIARAIEARYSKEEILEWYLNVIEYGPGLWNIRAATRHYFGKGPAQVTLNEALSLGSLLPAPTRYSPLVDVHLFRKARHVALRRLVAVGLLRPDHAPLFADAPHHQVLGDWPVPAYEQLYALLWQDATGLRKIAVPSLTTGIIAHLLSDPPNPEALLAHAERCLARPTRYLYGGLMERLTPSRVHTLARTYPEAYPQATIDTLLAASVEEPPVYGCDCSGLLKAFYFGLDRAAYAYFLDRNSRMLLDGARDKGPSETRPELPGICLYLPGHVGIYRGQGQVIESTANPAFGDGVVVTQITDRPWTHWFLCPFVRYPSWPDAHA